MEMTLSLPVATWHPNPLNQADGRVISRAPFEPEESIGEYLDRMGWDAAIDRPSKVMLNGKEIPRIQWLGVMPGPTDMVSVHACLAGDDSDVGRSILMIAVLAASVFVPGLMGMTAGTFEFAMAAAAISIGGSMIVNAIMPVDTKENKGEKDESPSYSVSGGSNSLRPYEALPIVIGKHRIFPDIDEKPYTWFESREDGDDQFLSQTFNFGLGTLQLSSHRLGESPVEDLGVQDLKVGKTTIDNVDTAEGNVLQFSTGWVTRSSPVDTVEIAIDLGGVCAEYNSQGVAQSKTVEFTAEYSPFGAGTWTALSFPSVVVGYTADAWQDILVDGVSVTKDTPPAGDGWFLFDNEVYGANGP